MKTLRRRCSNGLVPLLLAGFSAATGYGCSASTDSGGTVSGPTSTTTGTGDGERAIEEADIIQRDGGRLYAMSKSGTVSIVDVSTPGRLALLGQTTVPGQPFEMYRRGAYLLAMSNGAVAPDGKVRTGNTISWTNRSVSGSDGDGALVVVLDVQDPAQLRALATFPVPGEIADSRVVGDVLYMATYEDALCYRCGAARRTMVTSFDIASPTAMRQVEQVSFQSDAPAGYGVPWAANWKRSIFVTAQRLYVGGHADVDPTSFGVHGTKEGIIDVLDVTDPGGRLGVGAHLEVVGAILNRWQLDETDGVLRVISQAGQGRTPNGIGAPEVDTFAVDSASSLTPLGHTTLQLPRQELLRAVRFDGPRAYAITYPQPTHYDPMFVIDLADPTNPVQRGQLAMPGFMYYLEPYGDRVIGLGIDPSDAEGSLNVSLFDVSDPDKPLMRKRVGFATPWITSEYNILNGEVPEDQDRIQKAFRVFPDGLVAVPFAALRPYNAAGSGCDNDGGGVQLVEWSNDTLIKRALLPLAGHPRRAFETDQELIAVSDSNVTSFSLANRNVAHQTADLVIGTCTATTGLQDESTGMACSAAPGRGGASGAALFFVFLFGLGALATKRRATARLTRDRGARRPGRRCA